MNDHVIRSQKNPQDMRGLVGREHGNGRAAFPGAPAAHTKS